MAGTLESSDVMVRIAPAEGPQHDLLIASSVEKQFGAAIRHPAGKLQRHEVEPVQVIVDDKGALDGVLRAR
ncbi:citrate lyase acyl carrier protein [Serratia ureilytica]